MRHTLHLLPLVLLLGCPKGDDGDSDDTDTDDTDAVPTGRLGPTVSGACGIPEGDLEVDERLLRWPYYTSVTDTEAVVQFGGQPGADLTFEWGTDGTFGTTSESTTAPIDELVNPLALHKVTLSDLEPQTVYCFRILQDGDDLTGPIGFRTAPADDTDETIRFIVLGDYGSGAPVALRVLDQIKLEWDDIDFWMTTGDNAYSDGEHEEWQYNHFFLYRELLRRVPYFPLPGNHDYYTDDAQPYLDNFVLPEQALRAEDQERYYSFDWGPMHVLMLDSEQSARNVTPDVEDDDMMEWAVDDLAANQERPWRFAAWHRPPYYSERDRTDDPAFQAKMLPPIEEGNVEVALFGHSHIYDRMDHVKDGERVDWGTTYVVTGGGGAGIDFIYGDTATFRPAVELRSEAASINHYMLFEMDKCTIKAKAISWEGDLVDEWERDRCNR